MQGVTTSEMTGNVCATSDLLIWDFVGVLVRIQSEILLTFLYAMYICSCIVKITKSNILNYFNFVYIIFD